MKKQNVRTNFLTKLQAGVLIFVIFFGFSSVAQAQVCTAQVDGNLQQYQEEVLNGNHPSAVSVLFENYTPLDNLGPWHTVDPKDVNGTWTAGNCTATTLSSDLVVDFDDVCLQSWWFELLANIWTIDPSGLPIDTEIEWHYNGTYFDTTELDEPLQWQNEGIYTLYINKWFACEYTDQINIQFIPDPDIDSTVIASTCNNGSDQNDGSVTIVVDTNDIGDAWWTHDNNETSLSLNGLSAWTYMFEYTYGGTNNMDCNANIPIEVPGTDCPAFSCEGLAIDLSSNITELSCGLEYSDILIEMSEPTSATSSALYEIWIDGTMITNSLTASSFPYIVSNYAIDQNYDIQVRVAWLQDDPACTKEASISFTAWECPPPCEWFDMTANIESNNVSCTEDIGEATLSIVAWDDLDGTTVTINDWTTDIDTTSISSNAASIALTNLSWWSTIYTATIDTTDWEWNQVTCTAQTEVIIEGPEVPVITSSSDVSCLDDGNGQASLEAQSSDTGDWSWKDASGTEVATTATTTVTTAWTYTVTLTDSNWCESEEESVTIWFDQCVPDEPTCDGVNLQYSGITSAVIDATSSAWASTCEENGGFDLDLNNITWWEGPYIVTIDGVQYTSQNDIDDLVADTYTMTIEDTNWCTDTESFTVGCELLACTPVNVEVITWEIECPNAEVFFDMKDISWWLVTISIEEELESGEVVNIVSLTNINPNDLFEYELPEGTFNYVITPPLEAQCTVEDWFDVTIIGCDDEPVIECGDLWFDYENDDHNPNGSYTCNGVNDITSCDQQGCNAQCTCNWESVSTDTSWDNNWWDPDEHNASDPVACNETWFDHDNSVHNPESLYTCDGESDTTSCDAQWCSDQCVCIWEPIEINFGSTGCIVDPSLQSPDSENSNPDNFSNAVVCSPDEDLNGAEVYWDKVWSENDCVDGVQCQRYIPWSCGSLDDSSQILFSKRKHTDPTERCDYGDVPTDTNGWEYMFEATEWSFPFTASWKCPAFEWELDPSIECEFKVYPVPLCYDLNVNIEWTTDTNQSLVIGHDLSWDSWDGLITWQAEVVDDWKWGKTNPVSYDQAWPYSIEIQMNGTTNPWWVTVATSCIKTVLVWDIVPPNPIDPGQDTNTTPCGPVNGMTIDEPEYGIDLVFAWWLDSFCDTDWNKSVNYSPSTRSYFWTCPGMTPDQEVCEIFLNPEEDDGSGLVSDQGWWGLASVGRRGWGSWRITSVSPPSSNSNNRTPVVATPSVTPVQVHGVPIAPVHGVPIQNIVEITELLEIVEVEVPKEQTAERVRMQDISQQCYYEDGHTTEATDFEDMSPELSEKVNELNAAHCIWNGFSDNKTRFRPRQKVTLGEQLKTFARHLKLNREWFHDIVLGKEGQIDRGREYYEVLSDEMTLSVPAWFITTDTLHAPVDMSMALWLFIDIIDHFVPEVPSEDLTTIRNIVAQYQGQSYTREDMVYMTAFLNQYLLKKNPFAFQTSLVEVGNAEQNPTEASIASAQAFIEQEAEANEIDSDDFRYRGNELDKAN